MKLNFLLKLSILLVFVNLALISSAQWTQIGADINGETAYDYSGSSVGLSDDGSVMAVGSPNNDANGSDAGIVKVYENIADSWIQVGNNLIGEASGDLFGSRVSLSADGSILAVSSPYNNGSAVDAGSVRVYENISENWVQIGSDIDGEVSYDCFGSSLSLSNDGSTLAIGSKNNDGNGNTAGHVRVFQNNSNNWTQIGQDIDGESAADAFGASVSLNTDGSIISIGSLRSNAHNIDAGSLSVFQNTGNDWVQVGNTIYGDNTADKFGASVSINDNGNIVAVAATESDVNGNNSGQVKIYENILGNWVQIGSSIPGDFSNEKFGSAISLNADGTFLIIGAFESDESGLNSGKVKIFKNSSNNWQQIGNNIVGESANNQTGFSVGLSANGSIIAIGSKGHSGNNSYAGDARVFDYSCDAINNYDLGNDTIICNNLISLDAGVGYNYEWSTGEFTQTIEVSDSGYFYVTVSAFDCSSTDSTHIGFIESPNIDLLSDTTLCIDDTITIDAGSFSSYLWNTGENTQTIEVSTPGYYSVLVSNNLNNCITIDSINVVQSIVNTGLPDTIYVITGENITISANPENENVWNSTFTSDYFTFNPWSDTTLYLQATNIHNCSISGSIFIDTFLDFECDDSIFVALNVDTSITALIQSKLIGDNISTSNITSNISLDSNAIGYFCNPIDTTFGLTSGVVFCNGAISDIANPFAINASTTIGTGSDPDLETIPGPTIYDAIVIEFDYIPYTNIMSFSYIFASEEFPEFATGSYNDAFGFFVSGPGFGNDAENIALIPGTTNPVTINDIYQGGTGPFYIDSEDIGGSTIVYDGYTQPLDAIAQVIPFSTYHIKLAVADRGDSSYDSGVFLKNNSFSAWPLQYFINSQNIDNQSKTSYPVAIEDSSIITIDIQLPVVAQTDITYHYSILGTAENGIDYEVIADSITIPEDSIKASITITALQDDIVEGMETIVLVLDYLNDTITVNIGDNSEIDTFVEEEEKINLKLYPNPASQNFTIQNGDFIGKSFQINIYNPVGKLIHSENCKTSNTLINVEDWTQGIYIVAVEGQRVKFVKQ